jgi:glycosyltransferase A (GT-A) superfamily protein (DUF2064 family)
MQSHLLVLAKAPVPGRVKTRLSPPLTTVEAAVVAEAALADTFEAVAGCGADRLIVALDGEPGPWLPEGFEVVPQVPGSFNERLAAAWAFAGGPGLQIGMDTPQVTPAQLAAGVRALDGAAGVLGMANDGGYWGIGLQAPDPAVFAGVPMSDDRTGMLQLRRMRALGCEPARLGVLRDVDLIADARAVAALAPQTRFAATLAAIEPRIAARARVAA